MSYRDFREAILNMFYEFAKALKDKDKKKASLGTEREKRDFRELWYYEISKKGKQFEICN